MGNGAGVSGRDEGAGRVKPARLPLPTDEAFARKQDTLDPLRGLRTEFVYPLRENGDPVAYFCGNSLGLMPRRAAVYVESELGAWGLSAVAGHHPAEGHPKPPEHLPWYRYHECLRAPLARLAGAKELEVVTMNSLTVNLHLLMATFFRPDADRYKVLVEDPIFPSDLFAMKTQLRHHGLDPRTSLISVGPREGEAAVREDDLEAAILRNGKQLALVLLGGVNFLTGQRFDLKRITRAAHGVGARAGFDLAHSMGNVPLALHDWDVDFAVWCSYKYLNAGPGAPGGAFVHERHAKNTGLPRLAGWWGNDPATRFRMQLEPEFQAVPSADGWQLSNPPILSMAPLRASLELFDRVGMEALRAKQLAVTDYLRRLLEAELGSKLAIMTPADPESHGAQLSLRLKDGASRLERELARHGVVGDFREPDVIRAAAVPFTTGYHDAWTLVQVLRNLLR
jgi:kynureninase